MTTTPKKVRQQVLRRVRYAMNYLALESDSVPPEGPFDTALTNGLVSIVASEWPGTEMNRGDQKLKSASRLLKIIEESGGLDCVELPALREGLALTQPLRHGRADDEFAAITTIHLSALEKLDTHHSLRFLNAARGHTLDECIVVAFRERAEEELPFDPKDRLETPEPEECEACWRETFLRSGWDIFGGTMTEGACLACGFEVSAGEAYDKAVESEWAKRMNEES